MIKIRDVIYVRYLAPDLDAMESFLLDFGMRTASKGPDILCMKGLGGAPYLHVTERASQARGAGFGLLLDEREDIDELAARLNVPVRELHEPAVGRYLRIADPAGFDVDLVRCEMIRPLDIPSVHEANYGTRKSRHGSTVRLHGGPSHVLRLGHVVLKTPLADDCFRFYAEMFGMKVSDSYFAGAPENTIGRFMRCDLGTEFTDHHTIAIFRNENTKVDHSAFEVLDWDDLMIGSAHLTTAGRRHAWGVGRHVEGSQVFDYWRDPYDNKIEHWTDGDLVNESYVSGHEQISPKGLHQWGPAVDPSFFE